jgi:hypothetical protein
MNLGAEILPGDPGASVGGPAGEEPGLRENPTTGTRLCGRPASIGLGLGHRGIDPGVRVGLPQLLGPGGRPWRRSQGKNLRD